jgi:hypothetical protein
MDEFQQDMFQVDGMYNDETNIAECMFDGLDCCSGFGFEVVTTDCTECSCHGMYLYGSFFLSLL